MSSPTPAFLTSIETMKNYKITEEPLHSEVCKTDNSCTYKYFLAFCQGKKFYIRKKVQKSGVISSQGYAMNLDSKNWSSGKNDFIKKLVKL